jgi:hypothetical protein
MLSSKVVQSLNLKTQLSLGYTNLNPDDAQHCGMDDCVSNCMSTYNADEVVLSQKS